MSLLLSVGLRGHHAKVAAAVVVRVAIRMVNMLPVTLAHGTRLDHGAAGSVSLGPLALHLVAAVVLGVIGVHHWMRLYITATLRAVVTAAAPIGLAVDQ